MIDLDRPTTAETADELLTEVQQILIEDAKRYNQGYYVVRRAGVYGAIGWETLNELYGMPMADCGSVCCVAGWVTQRVKVKNFRNDECHDFAKNVLGLTKNQIQELFRGNAIDNIYDEMRHKCPEFVMPKFGTPEYAALGVLHIQRFRDKYAEQLKTTKIRR